MLKIDHGIHVGYVGIYNSSELDEKELWAISYELGVYAIVTEKVTLKIANFYTL